MVSIWVLLEGMEAGKITSESGAGALATCLLQADKRVASRSNPMEQY